MDENAEDIKTYRMETMKAFWPNVQIQTHLMSLLPSKWISQVLPYSDIIYLHAECKENLELLIKKIQEEGKIAGVALTLKTKPDDIKELLEKTDAILLLTIPKPGCSGQKFDTGGFESIRQINDFSFRNRLMLCVDGGVNDGLSDKHDYPSFLSCRKRIPTKDSCVNARSPP